MIIVTAQIELGTKTLYDELSEYEEFQIKDAVTSALRALGAEVAVVDIDDDGF